MSLSENIKYIADNISEGDILCQLAEEASEITKAALKLKRAIEGTNPTPVTRDDAIANLYEEYADICLCFSIVGVLFEGCSDDALLSTIVNKADRWRQRLESVKGGASDNNVGGNKKLDFGTLTYGKEDREGH